MSEIGVGGPGPGVRILDREILSEPRPPAPGPRTTVAFATLGCKLNQNDTTELQGMMEARGFRTVPFEDEAEIYVVNTCTVTGKADFSDRQMIRRAVQRNPNALVVVTGCWAQTDPQAIARMPGVDLIVGNQEKSRLVDLLDSLKKRVTPTVHVGDIGKARHVPVFPLPRALGRTRAFVKVQDGCQHRCAFCIVPFARGQSRSQLPDVVVDQVNELAEAGHLEVVLTGVDMGHYGWDLAPRSSFASLVARLETIPKLTAIRLSSILPQYFTDELIALITHSEKICPHLHIPLQSGSDRVLREMRRPYNTAMYRGLVERLAEAVPGLGLGADLIVGFPGETDDEFEETCAFVEALPFTYLHVFSYSPRKGTEAAALPNPLPPRVIRERSLKLRSLGRLKNLAFRREYLGKEIELLALDSRDKETGLLIGLSGNYIELLFAGDDSLMQSVQRVRITAVSQERTFGELV